MGQGTAGPLGLACECYVEEIATFALYSMFEQCCTERKRHVNDCNGGFSPTDMLIRVRLPASAMSRQGKLSPDDAAGDCRAVPTPPQGRFLRIIPTHVWVDLHEVTQPILFSGREIV